MTPATTTSGYLNCPECGLTLACRTGWEPEHCPRCIARRRVAVRLFASTLSARELYANGAAPGEEGSGDRQGHDRPRRGR